LFETSLAEHSDRNDGAASTKERDERDCPDGIAEQCRSDPHAHSHDEYDCGRNNGNKPVHGRDRDILFSEHMAKEPRRPRQLLNLGITKDEKIDDRPKPLLELLHIKQAGRRVPVRSKTRSWRRREEAAATRVGQPRSLAVAGRGVHPCAAASIERHPLCRSFRLALSKANQFPPFVAG